MSNLMAKPRGSKYTDAQRRHALGVFVVLGNIQATSKSTGIPRVTLQDWSKKEWWLNLISNVRQEKAQELDAQVSNSIAKAIKSVDDRLERGDAYVTKEGELAYKPVSARDSATVFGILYDKRQIMRLLPTSISQTTDSNKLLKLQESFEALANKKIKEVDATVVSQG